MKRHYTDPETGEVFEGYTLKDALRDLCSHPVASLFIVGLLLTGSVVMVQFL